MKELGEEEHGGRPHDGGCEGPKPGSAAPVAGPYDVIAIVEAASIDALGKIVVSRIQSVKGVTRTLTCPVVHI